MKLAVIAPVATVTDAGTVRALLLSETVTVAPLFDDNATVHVEVPPETTDAGEHCNAVMVVAAGVTVSDETKMIPKKTDTAKPKNVFIRLFPFVS